MDVGRKLSGRRRYFVSARYSRDDLLDNRRFLIIDFVDLMVRAVIGLNKSAVFKSFQVIGYEVLRLTKDVPELADAVSRFRSIRMIFKRSGWLSSFMYWSSPVTELPESISFSAQSSSSQSLRRAQSAGQQRAVAMVSDFTGDPKKVLPVDTGD